MTNARRSKKDRARLRPRSSRLRLTVVASSLTAVALVVGVVLATGGDEPRTSQTRAAMSLAETGEVNEMGMPVLETPGTASGVVSASGLEIRGANRAMGTVPLLVAVRPSWTLLNTSDTEITLGDPTPEVREGCCPGPLTLGTRTLAPGQTTELTFELGMHLGMDGWHDIAVHVPFRTSTGVTDAVTVDVTGDFRGEYLA